METKVRIIQTLEEFRDFFIEHNVNTWARRTELTIQQIREEKLDAVTVLKNYVSSGMGSLLDLYIDPLKEHQRSQRVIEINKELMELTNKILTIKEGLEKSRKRMLKYSKQGNR